MGFMAQCDGLHFIRGGHFKIQGHAQSINKALNIVVRNMAPVFAQMRSDPIRAGLFGKLGCTHRIRIGRTTRVSNGRNVVDVNT